MVENWTGLIVGMLVIVSPWVLGFSDISLAKWGNILLGLVLVLVNAWTMFGEPRPAKAVPTEEEQQRSKRKVKNNVG